MKTVPSHTGLPVGQTPTAAKCCRTCGHDKAAMNREPCRSCVVRPYSSMYSNWTPKATMPARETLADIACELDGQVFNLRLATSDWQPGMPAHHVKWHVDGAYLLHNNLQVIVAEMYRMAASPRWRRSCTGASAMCGNGCATGPRWRNTADGPRK